MVSPIFTYYQDHSAPYEAGTEQLMAIWSEQSLMLLRCKAGTALPLAIEGFQSNWHRMDTGSRLLEQSALLPLRDLPLLLISCGAAALPIPSEVFDPAKLRSELALFRSDQTPSISFSHPANEEIVIGWEMPETVWQFFTKQFATVTCRHLLHGLLQPPVEGDAIRLHAMTGGCWTAWWHQGKLCGVHHLPTESISNTCYALLRRCHHYGISPLEVPLFLSGLMASDAPLAIEIGRFFGHIHWLGQTTTAGTENIDIPAHYYHYLAESMPAAISL